MTRIQQIEALGPEYVPFAKQLHQMADSFEIEVMQTFIEQFMEKD